MQAENASAYEGGCFGADFNNGKCMGELRIEVDGLRFTALQSGEVVRVTLPYDGLRVSQGGASNRLIFFEHPAVPDRNVFTSDARILKDSAWVFHPEVDQIMRGFRNKRSAHYAAYLILAAAVLAGVIGLISLRHAAVASLAKNVPVEWEEKLGEAAFSQIRSGKQFVEDEALKNELKVITDAVLKGIPQQRYTFTFHIIEDPTLNAFAIPGGNVCIHTGLLLKAESAEEVAGVIAHEIAHVTMQHGIRRILETMGLYVVVQALLGDSSGILAVLADSGAFLLRQQFSRDQETEADNVGFEYLIKAQIDPAGFKTFFVKMEEEHGHGDGKAGLAYLSTHPLTERRIENIASRIEQLPASQQFVPIPLDYAKFKTALQGRLGVVPAENVEQAQLSEVPVGASP